MKKVNFHKVSELKNGLINNGKYFIKYSENTNNLLKYLINKGLFKNKNHIFYNNTNDILSSLKKGGFDIYLYSIDSETLNISLENNLIYNTFLNKKGIKELITLYDKLQNKVYAYKYIDELNLKISNKQHEIVQIDEIFNYLQNKITYPYIVKGSYGKGGKGNIVINNNYDYKIFNKIIKSDLYINKLERVKNNSEYIIEKYFDNKTDINVNLYISNQQYSILGITEQITEQVFYKGNQYNRNTLEFAKRYSGVIKQIALSLINIGYIGYIGIDFMIVNDEVYFNEFNTRINSSTVFGQHCKCNNITESSIMLFRFEQGPLTAKSIINLINFLYTNQNINMIPYEVNWDIGTIIYLCDNKFDEHLLDLMSKHGFILDIEYINDNSSINYYLKNLKF